MDYPFTFYALAVYRNDVDINVLGKNEKRCSDLDNIFPGAMAMT